jgi:Skp family chaperone for outer membrane proteins
MVDFIAHKGNIYVIIIMELPMKSKVLSLISTSFLILSVFTPQGYTNSTSIDEDTFSRAFRSYNMSERYQVPPRYEHLKKLQAVKLKTARREARQLAGKKQEGCTLESYQDESSKILKENSQKQLSEGAVQVEKSKETGHKRQRPILSRAELLVLPLSSSAVEHLEKVVPKDLKKIPQYQLKVWVEFGDSGSRHELERRHENYHALYKRHLTKMLKSQYKDPCLSSQVPLYPFAYEVIEEDKQWKQMYMEANFILARDPSSPVARSLLQNVIKYNPDFKYSYYRLYKLKNAEGHTHTAVNYLRKAASGPKGLAIAQYEYGLHLLSQGKQQKAKVWLKKASGQEYWVADEVLRKLYLERKQNIEVTLKNPKRLIVVKH